MSVDVRVSSLTSYLTDRLPDHYGGRQQEYLEVAERTIESGVCLIAEEMQKKSDPLAIYHTLIKVYQVARHNLALHHQTKKASLFGVRRDDPAIQERSYLTPYTRLIDQYDEYNKKHLDQLIPILRKIPHDLQRFFKTSFTKQGDALGRHYSFQIELLDGAELQKRKYMEIPSTKELQEALGIQDKTVEEIVHDFECMGRLKKERKDLYDQLVMSSIVIDLNRMFPSPKARGKVEERDIARFEWKSLYVLTTLRLEIEEGKMACMGRHLTWMYQDHVTDPINRMRGHSADYVIHQDPFLIERTQQFCAKIFAEILAWNRTKPVDDLKDRVALLRYTYAYSMPCTRGDGAVGDWLEFTLYRHHGFVKTRHARDQLPCFEPLSTIDLSDYIKNYRKTVIVE